MKKIIFAKNRGLAVYTAFPKSASKHVLGLLKAGTNNKLKIIKSKLSPGFGNNFLDKEKINKSSLMGFKQELIYGHIPYTSFNLSVLKDYGLNTNILVSIRPLPDIVISYKEHIEKNGFGPLDYRIFGVSECNPNWPRLNDKEKYDYIISFIIPWYIRYAVG